MIETIFPPKGHDLIKIGGFPFVSVPDRNGYVASVVSGRYDDAPCASDKNVKTVLDLGAGQGEFAYWAMKRWPECWVTCVETDPARLFTLRHNVRAGVKVIDTILMAGRLNPLSFDVVRITSPEFPTTLARLIEKQSVGLWDGFLIVDIISRGAT